MPSIKPEGNRGNNINAVNNSQRPVGQRPQSQPRPQQGQPRPQSQVRPQQGQPRPQQGQSRPQNNIPQQSANSQPTVKRVMQKQGNPSMAKQQQYAETQARIQQMQQQKANPHGKTPQQLGRDINAFQQANPVQDNEMYFETPNQNMQNQGMQFEQGQPYDDEFVDENMYVTDDNFYDATTNKKPKKKKSKKGLILIIVIGLFLALIVAAKNKKEKASVDEEVTDEVPATEQGYTGLINAMRDGWNPEKLDAVVGTTDGDSYLAREFSYANHVPLREEYLKTLGSMINITPISDVPQPQEGEAQEQVASSGGKVKVTVPDYDTIYKNMQAEQSVLLNLFKSAKYKKEDYLLSDELIQVMLQYILDRGGGIPMKEVEVNLMLSKTPEGFTYIVDDGELDKALFSQPSFFECCKLTSQVCMEWVDHTTEVYYEKEEKRNPDYDAWYKIFKERYDADGGKFTKNSLWEPWYLRDDNNNIQVDENGEYIVNYYSVKDADGNDWIQPDEFVLVEVEKQRTIPIEWVDETGMLYNWIGAYYIQNEYNGKGSKAVPIGDGSREFPAGIGTPICTRVLCTDGTYATVMVTLLGYWIDEDAINYAEQFSQRNRGFTTTMVSRLLTCEFNVENLEQHPITFANSELVLCDKNANISSRTGSVYGFTGEVTLQPKGKKYSSIVMNDWYSSPELEQKYLCWSRSFGRDIKPVYFYALAGTGVVPKYSAYELFTQTDAQLKDSTDANNPNQSAGATGDRPAQQK